MVSEVEVLCRVNEEAGLRIVDFLPVLCPQPALVYLRGLLDILGRQRYGVSVRVPKGEYGLHLARQVCSRDYACEVDLLYAERRWSRF